MLDDVNGWARAPYSIDYFPYKETRAERVLQHDAIMFHGPAAMRGISSHSHSYCRGEIFANYIGKPVHGIFCQ